MSICKERHKEMIVQIYLEMSSHFCFPQIYTLNGCKKCNIYSNKYQLYINSYLRIDLLFYSSIFILNLITMSHIPQVIFLTFIRSKSKYWICGIEEITIPLFRNLQTKAKSLEKFFLDWCHIINLLYGKFQWNKLMCIWIHVWIHVKYSN